MSHNTALFYTIPKVKMTNNAKEAIVLEITLEPYSSVIINMCKPQEIKLSITPYSVNQPTNLQLQDSSFYLISIFEINKYLKSNTKNIGYLSYRIATFIRQQKLKDKTAEDILQIAKFGFTTWNFILPIYKSG